MASKRKFSIQKPCPVKKTTPSPGVLVIEEQSTILDNVGMKKGVRMENKLIRVSHNPYFDISIFQEKL